MTTNVPAPTFGPTGFTAPLESQVLAGVQLDLQAAFGGALNMATSSGGTTNSTPQSQLAMSMTGIIGFVNDTFIFYTQQVDPAYAEGRMQDGIGRIYFMERNSAQPTVLQISCNGGPIAIPIGAQVQDPAGNIYTCTVAGAIPDTGSIVLPFACTVPGPVPVPGTVAIFQAIPGWDSATVSSGTIGQNTESRAAFETRRAQSTAKNSMGVVASVRGAVLAVPGVTDAFVTDNPLSAPVTIGGFTLAPNSLFVAVNPGTASQQAIAFAIWTKKGGGCNMNGNTTIVVQDTVSGYAPPLPSYNITYFDVTLNPLPVYFSVVLLAAASPPSNATALVQGAINNAFAGGTFGPNNSTIPRPTIGSTILASSFLAPIQALGSWAQVVSLGIGSPNVPNATFVGSISSTTLTVSTLNSGAIGVGQILDDTTGAIPAGTTILQQLSGVTGGVGTYQLNNSMTVASENITSVLPNGNSVAVGISQMPTLAEPNIIVSTQ